MAAAFGTGFPSFRRQVFDRRACHSDLGSIGEENHFKGFLCLGERPGASRARGLAHLNLTSTGTASRERLTVL